MDEDAIDLVGDPAVISRIAALAVSQGLEASKPMPTESISDAFDAPITMEDIKPICDVITVIAGTGVSVVKFLSAVKVLLGKSDTTSGREPEVEVRKTKGQKRIGRINSKTDISKLER